MTKLPKHYLAWILRSRKKLGKTTKLFAKFSVFDQKREKRNAGFLYCYNQAASKTFAIAKFKKKKKQPGALAKALPDIIMETDITAIKDEWKTFMAVKNSNLPAFNCDIGTSTITG